MGVMPAPVMGSRRAGRGAIPLRQTGDGGMARQSESGATSIVCPHGRELWAEDILQWRRQVSATKIVLIGEGGVSWGPKVVTDLVLTDGLERSTITLTDLGAEALKQVLKLSEMIVARTERDFTLEAKTYRREALLGTDYVVTTIPAGGFETMRRDLAVPCNYGVRQSVGDTTGPGGLSRALRNVPIILEIAQDMESICPQA